MTNTTTVNAGAFALDTHLYKYNQANQGTAITNVDSSRWVYQYDALGQVVLGENIGRTGLPLRGKYGFDDIGKRKTTATEGDAVGATCVTPVTPPTT